MRTKLLSLVLAAAILTIALLPPSLAAEEGEDLSAPAPVLLREGSYGAYLEKNGLDAQNCVSGEIIIEAELFARAEPLLQESSAFSPAGGVETLEEGYIEWDFHVQKAGLYNIELRYHNLPGRGATMERTVYIDGELPYRELQYVRFPRLWEDTYVFGEIDNFGNSVRPGYQEIDAFQSVFITDASGYYDRPLAVYLSEGEHTLRLISEREPMFIDYIRLTGYQNPPSYAELKDEYEQKGYGPATSGSLAESGRLIQAENAAARTDKANYPVSDRSSSATMPQDAYHILINGITGDKWQNNGSAVYWDFTPDATGLYTLSMRCRQYVNKGLISTRSLTIDGVVPFQEAGNLRFIYSSDWEVVTLGDEVNGAYEFYFEAGKTYRLGLTADLGDMREILRRVESSVFKLNEIYRSILMITGPSPDKDRDYSFKKNIPGVLADMAVQAGELADISAQIDALVGTKSAQSVQIDKLVLLLRRITEKPDDIAATFSNFKENIGALSAWLLTCSKQPLDIDWLALSLEGDKLPKARGGFFEELGFGLKAFFATFAIDYTKVGTVSDVAYDQNVTVWLASGRDQSQIVRQMIDSSFTPEHNITVNLQLVAGGTLLPSILSGAGPDVYLGAGNGDPVNFATRNAVQDLLVFPDFAEVTERFHPSAFVPYTYADKVFALPETQSFMMMFYRTDIFEELGLSPPETWTEFNELIPELQTRNLSVGMPKGIVNPASGDMNMFLTFLYQGGSELYRENGKYTNLDSSEAVAAFTKFTNYYNLYKFPVDYDFANRFRSGEMPIGFADYTLYNQFAVFAPEIKGLWAFTSVPGTLKEDGSIDRSIPAGGSAVIMMNNLENKDLAWEFMKWWTSAGAQADFGVGMESILGESAMYATANMEALAMLPWQSKDYRSITEQWQNIVGTPEVPGGYYTYRSYAFAFNRLINSYKNQKTNNVYDLVDPGDIMQDYIAPMNSEFTRKREEFGLS